MSILIALQGSVSGINASGSKATPIDRAPTHAGTADVRPLIGGWSRPG
jgi:hypothetical protein